MPKVLTERRTEIEDVLGTAEVAHILGVHPRTVERRRAAVHRLSPLETQRKEKLQRIWKQLLELYNPENALQWLESAVPVLGYRRPVDVMAEDGGLDRVLDVVGRMSWGIPS
jgi:putative toxin-antitoxin system antitoxin component (TIGR02293 family)